MRNNDIPINVAFWNRQILNVKSVGSSCVNCKLTSRNVKLLCKTAISRLYDLLNFTVLKMYVFKNQWLMINNNLYD